MNLFPKSSSKASSETMYNAIPAITPEKITAADTTEDLPVLSSLISGLFITAFTFTLLSPESDIYACYSADARTEYQ